MARQIHAPRRGVVLLVILSLLVLFALLGVTFVLVSGQYKRSSYAFMRAETYGDDWARQVDTALYIALRDSKDAANPLRTHSLLNDIYGHESYYGTVSSASNASFGAGQLVDIQCSLQTLGMTAPAADANVSGYFNGCVLTFYRPANAAAGSNKLAGNSTRIVGSAYDSTGGFYILRCMRPTADDANNVVAQVGDRFLVNGKAFSGAGAGFNVASGNLDLTSPSTGGLHALEPNQRFATNNALVQNDGYAYGRMNENWDAPDLQNLYLSATIPDPSEPSGIKHITIGSKKYPCIIPSFHRPALVQRNSGTMTAQNSFRPLSVDANFPQLGDQNLSAQDRPVYGPWDVDTDGDGIADSIWIDLNLPVQTSSDGRRYKPLFAIKIEDLDNRINVNFQGNEQHYSPQAVSNGLYLADGSQTNAYPIKGTGLGPPEVVMKLGLGLTDTQYQQLLIGNGTLPGRYGSDGVAGSGASGTPTPIASDTISSTKFFTIPGNYSAGGGAYQSPPDMVGQLARGVSPQGQLVTDVPTDTASDLRARAAYRTRALHDSRFVPNELERILRYYDVDAAQLPSRLENLAGVLSGGSPLYTHNRRLVTTASYDVPAAVATPTRSLLSGGNHETYRDPMALLRKRLGSSMLSETQILAFVDRDLYFGLKMDLNRPLGDGVDSNGNNVVDEAEAGEVGAEFGLGFNAVNGEDFDGNGSTDATDQLYARHQLAKHLYVLASLCVDTGLTPDQAVQHQLAQWAINVVDFRDSDAIMTPFEYDPNPFDGWNPDCDGNIGAGEAFGASRRLVWGLERPELLLTESLAMHDRRTQDTEDEDPVDMAGGDTQKMKGRTTDADDKKDGDFDQKFKPEGSAFIEIYNPWQSVVERRPAEFYYRNESNATGWLPGGTMQQSGVQLDQVSRQGNSPVWRLMIVKDAGIGMDPDELDPAGQQIANADKERCVYFTKPLGRVDTSDNAGRPYFPNVPDMPGPNDRLAPLLPGRYAIIGSGAEGPIGTPPVYTTYFGFKNDNAAVESNDATSLGETRQIVLAPNPDSNVNQVKILNNGHSVRTDLDYTDNTTLNVQPVVAVVINQTTTDGTTTDGTTSDYERFSFSEPVGGYTLGGMHMAAAPLDPTGLRVITPVIDKPLDAADDRKDIFMKDGMHQQYRVVHLQRLANPLVAHNKTTNPYLTIDTLGADMVVFNGVASGEPNTDGGPNDQAFETLQRGDLPQPATPQRLLWKRSTIQNLTAVAEADATHFWGRKLDHTLGYLNSSYGSYYTTDSAAARKGDPDLQGGTLPTFPWLTWNNRPFNSVYELLDVPMTKSSLLTRDFKIPSTLTNPYSQDQANHAFGHLPNFFYDQAGAPQINGMYRLFDYLRVPSKFVEADTMLTASSFATTDLNTQNQFHPPYNWLSNFRDPGLININTIYSENVWYAVLGGDPTAMGNEVYGLGPSFAKLVASRRGYGTSADILERDGTTPTEFANVFRTAGTGNMGGTIATMDKSGDPIESTFLRPDKDAASNPPNMPLFGNAFGSTAATMNATFNNSARHPYFRHQTLQRLSNTLTTRSNVYACWITVGYFEVDNTGLLGQELHADTGEIKRHRAFYMIDRTIPVGFEPGENHNVDRAILVRRYIE